jgi:hypothetical protein
VYSGSLSAKWRRKSLKVDGPPLFGRPAVGFIDGVAGLSRPNQAWTAVDRRLPKKKAQDALV